jgi:hypothetical protein
VHVPLPGFDGARRFEFLLERGEAPDTMTSPASTAQLLRSIGVDPRQVTVLRATVYTFHSREASAWRAGPRGRVLLLGDAAHCMPPFRGQGMCAGMMDAGNACWKVLEALALLRTRRGGAGAGAGAAAAAAAEALLDSYELERRAHVRAVVHIAQSMGALIMLRRPPLTWARNALFWALDRFPLTTAWAKNPLGKLPAGFDAGLLDFHARGGLRGAAPALPLWAARDTATGMPVPNLPVLDEEGRPGRLDEALWRAATAATRGRPSAGRAASRAAAAAAHKAAAVDADANADADADADADAAPAWIVLLAPGTSVLSRGDHPAFACAAAHGVSGPRCRVVQLLPAVSSEVRLREFFSAKARGECAGDEPWAGGADWAVADATAGLGAWFEAMGAIAVVVRPDRIVFGAYAQAEWPVASARLADLWGGGAGPHLLKKRQRYPPSVALVLIALVLASGGIFALLSASR